MAVQTRPDTGLYAGLSREEKVGLAVAIAAHLALVAWLWVSPLGKAVQPPPERMTVTLSDEVAPDSTSPEPLAQAAPDVAPALGEPAPAVEAVPEPLPSVAPPPPAPKVIPTPQPRPSAAPAKVAPKPQPKLPPKPQPSAAPAKPVARQATATPAPARPADNRARRRPDAPEGASRLGSDFLKGVGAEARGTAQAAPAARAGPQVAASLSQAISRQLQPHWTAPQGAEADLLVTVLTFDLNPDGSLKGRPRVVSQSGVTDANRAQKDRHAEMAIRAVQLAAPFDLPDQYYALWKHVASFRFDRRL